MRAIYIISEGQTEEEFIEKVLCNHFYANEIYDVRPILLSTSKTSKGGALNYDRFKNNILKLAKTEPNVMLTSMIDFFRLDNSFPRFQESLAIVDKFARVKFLEKAMLDDIGYSNFIPYIQMHEFEGLLFSDIEGFDIIPDLTTNLRNQLEGIINGYPTPEHINDGPDTAPSKRLKIIPGYRKTLHGPYLAEAIGVDTIMNMCPKFAEWITTLVETYKEKNR